jgi:molybdopterin molybdotransferase
VEVRDLGVVRDDPAQLEAAFRAAAAQADAIVTTGGVSVGEADFVIVLEHERGRVQAGEAVQVQPFEGLA